MMLHLGNDQGVAWQHIIAILNLSSLSDETQKHMRNIKPECIFYTQPDEEPKSVVLAVVDKKTCIYYSSISANVLLRRSVNFHWRLSSGGAT